MFMEKSVSVLTLCLWQSMEFICCDGSIASFRNSSLLAVFQILEAGWKGSVLISLFSEALKRKVTSIVTRALITV